MDAVLLLLGGDSQESQDDAAVRLGKRPSSEGGGPAKVQRPQRDVAGATVGSERGDRAHEEPQGTLAALLAIAEDSQDASMDVGMDNSSQGEMFASGQEHKGISAMQEAAGEARKGVIPGEHRLPLKPMSLLEESQESNAMGLQARSPSPLLASSLPATPPPLSMVNLSDFEEDEEEEHGRDRKECIEWQSRDTDALSQQRLEEGQRGQGARPADQGSEKEREDEELPGAELGLDSLFDMSLGLNPSQQSNRSPLRPLDSDDDTESTRGALLDGSEGEEELCMDKILADDRDRGLEGAGTATETEDDGEALGEELALGGGRRLKLKRRRSSARCLANTIISLSQEQRYAGAREAVTSGAVTPVPRGCRDTTDREGMRLLLLALTGGGAVAWAALLPYGRSTLQPREAGVTADGALPPRATGVALLPEFSSSAFFIPLTEASPLLFRAGRVELGDPWRGAMTGGEENVEESPKDPGRRLLQALLEDPSVKKVTCGLQRALEALALAGVNITRAAAGSTDLEAAAWLSSLSSRAGLAATAAAAMALPGAGSSCAVVAEECENLGKSCGSSSDVAAALLRCHRLSGPLSSFIEHEGLLQALSLEASVAPSTAAMATTGVAIDRSQLSDLMAAASLALSKAEAAVSEEVGRSVNLNDSRDVAVALFADLGLRRPSAGGAPSKRSPIAAAEAHALIPWDVPKEIASEATEEAAGGVGDAALAALAGEHELARLALAHRRCRRLHATAETLSRAVASDGRVRPTWESAGAATGRMASFGPCLTSLPASPLALPPSIASVAPRGLWLRRTLVASPGHTFLAVDYRQAEVRVLAYLSSDQALSRLLSTGGDVHRQIAACWLKKTPSDVTEEERHDSKRVVFAMLYGVGAKGLARLLAVPVAEAASFMSAFLAAFPGVAAWMCRAVEEARAALIVRSPFSRRIRRLPDLSAAAAPPRRAAERKAVNTHVQAGVADLAKRAQAAVCRLLYAASSSQGSHSFCRLVLQAHDELLFEVEEDRLLDAAVLVKRAMEDAALPVDMPVSLRHGPSLGDLCSVEQIPSPRFFPVVSSFLVWRGRHIVCSVIPEPAVSGHLLLFPRSPASSWARISEDSAREAAEMSRSLCLALEEAAWASGISTWTSGAAPACLHFVAVRGSGRMPSQPRLEAAAASLLQWGPTATEPPQNATRLRAAVVAALRGRGIEDCPSCE